LSSKVPTSSEKSEFVEHKRRERNEVFLLFILPEIIPRDSRRFHFDDSLTSDEIGCKRLIEVESEEKTSIDEDIPRSWGTNNWIDKSSCNTTENSKCFD
jgi:hypothetical protein